MSEKFQTFQMFSNNGVKMADIKEGCVDHGFRSRPGVHYGVHQCAGGQGHN